MTMINIHIGASQIVVSFSADFTIRHDSTQQRMVFSGYSNLDVSPQQGSWSTTGVNAVIIEGGRTYKFTIGGKLTYLGITTEHTQEVTFSCSATGVIS
ncbi:MULTISPECIES: hypothetical protein [Lysinibacillus]|uniref:hypothetical protein n=1 Tax=Lysinibacillus TaxID=400634 RepID=UPI001111D320|nr:MULTISPECIES: hypothetical protein [Lysinibacillus]